MSATCGPEVKMNGLPGGRKLLAVTSILGGLLGLAETAPAAAALTSAVGHALPLRVRTQHDRNRTHTRHEPCFDPEAGF
jgi:hypothetical protein